MMNKDWSGQYLTSVDLTIGDQIIGEGNTFYFANSFQQKDRILQIVEKLQRSPVNTSEIGKNLKIIKESVQKNQPLLKLFAIPKEPAYEWTNAEKMDMTRKMDMITIPFVRAIQSLARQLKQLEESARQDVSQADQQRRQINSMAIVSGAFYLFIVMLGWSWFRQQIVTPLESLSAATDASLRIPQDYSVETLRPSGPTEIRLLTSGIQNAVHDLRVARDEAIDASKAKDLFLANISHELRTPMNSIVGMSELVVATGLTAQQGEYLRILRGSASSLMQLINDLLDVSRIASGKLTLTSEPFELRETVSDVLDMVSTKAFEQGLELTLWIAPDVSDALTGDSLRLKQVILNLLSNAIKFTSEGHVSLTITCTDVEPDLSRSVYETTLLFTVADTGIGIAKDKHQSIFSAFEQVDGSWTRTHDGAGLGLAISRELVELMEGRIWVEERHPQGSSFHFTIRILATADDRSRSQPALPDLANHSVLIVDNDDMNRRSLEELLSGWKMKPVSTDTLNLALSTLRQSAGSRLRFSLVIVGLRDFSTDIDNRIRQIRSLSMYADVPIIIVAPCGQLFADCDNDNDIVFLPKPVRQSRLMRTIVSLMTQSTTEESVLRDDSPPGTSSTLRILVAEDNIPNQKIISLMLKNAGHRATLVGTGRQALSSFSTDTFDLVFMDIQMPDMDGLQATIEIRKIEQQSGTHIPIVGITGHAMEQHLEEARRAGMDRFVIKPFTSEELLAALV